MRKKKGIGIFGLTADPFHNGHLQIISELAEKPYINRLDVVPTWKPPYKECSDYETRCLFVAHGVSSQYLLNVVVRYFKVQYTHQLIGAYKRETDLPLYLFVGSDWDMSTWKNFDYIKNNCNIIQYDRTTCLPISSTMIRNKVKNGEPINGYVNSTTLQIIKDEKLYV